jgi:hypothetical protein
MSMALSPSTPTPNQPASWLPAITPAAARSCRAPQPQGVQAAEHVVRVGDEHVRVGDRGDAVGQVEAAGYQQHDRREQDQAVALALHAAPVPGRLDSCRCHCDLLCRNRSDPPRVPPGSASPLFSVQAPMEGSATYIVCGPTATVRYSLGDNRLVRAGDPDVHGQSATNAEFPGTDAALPLRLITDHASTCLAPTSFSGAVRGEWPGETLRTRWPCTGGKCRKRPDQGVWTPDPRERSRVGLCR